MYKTSLKRGYVGPIQRRVDACLVLQYHRIASLSFDVLQLAVESHHFEEQIEYLVENFNVISIEEMQRHLDTSRPFKQRSIVITFDGGYSDVLYMAKDVLIKHGIPATVFATSADILEGGIYWWKVLEDYLIANTFGRRLELEIDSRLRRWSLLTQFDRYQAFDDLYSILLNTAPLERRKIMEEMSQSLELQAEELDNHRTMSAQELKQLANGGLITVGGHTHHGTQLSNIPKCDQIVEILKNKNILEEVLGCPVEYFSYPFGNETHTLEMICILQEVRYSLACGNSYGMVDITGRTSLYDLPRVKVGNWNKFAFHRFLRRFFD